MKMTRFVAAALLMVASAGALRAVWAGQAGNRAASENREEQSEMTNEKVIMLIEAKIQPQRRAEILDAARQYLPLVRAEPGVEAFYITARKDDEPAGQIHDDGLPMDSLSQRRQSVPHHGSALVIPEGVSAFAGKRTRVQRERTRAQREIDVG